MVDASPPVSAARVIVVVDDDEDVAAALGSLIESMGLQSHIFPSADAFLAGPQEVPVALVISDVQMPGTSGIELARILQPRGVPVILITAFPGAEIERKAKEAGVHCFLLKPFDPANLIACIERALEG